MPNPEQIENCRTVYDQEGLRAEVVDTCAIALYIEDIFRCEITLEEWNNINMALEGVRNEQV